MSVRQDDVLMERADQLITIMHVLKKGIDNRVGNALHNNMKDKLTIPQMTVLGNILSNDRITMRALAAKSNVAMSTMSEMVNRLVRLRLVSRKQDKFDRRITQIELTGKGRKMFEEKYRIAQKGFAQVLESLSENDQLKLLKAFKSIETIINKTMNERNDS